MHATPFIAGNFAPTKKNNELFVQFQFLKTTLMKYLFTLFSFLLGWNGFSQAIIQITDADLAGEETYQWTKNNTYVLDGLVFLEEGSVLSIEAGTIIKFTPRADVGNPSALVITRGAQIFAEGTSENPIIFTSEADDVNNPSDLGPTDNALWGGIVLLGRGITQKNGNAEVNIEGIDLSEPRGAYGGNDNTDNSGVLRYVSIRHGGRQIVSGSELNGLSLGAVGSGTTLEYIEIYANSDDGIEFFGGAPNLKYAVVAFVEDDSYDWDEVYSGKGQFWFSIQRPDIADAGGELDGSTPDDLTPYSNPTIYNWTHIGSGPGATASNPVGWLLRAGTAGTIANSIVTEMKNKVIEVQDKDAGTNDAHQKLINGELKLPGNLFWANGSNTTLDATSTGIIRVTSNQPNQDDADASDLIAHLVANNSTIANPGIRRISREQDSSLDPRPTETGAAYTNPREAYPAGDLFFTDVEYSGAFSAEAEQLWIAGWTTLERNGHLGLVVAVDEVEDDQLANDIRIYPNPVVQGGIFEIETSLTAAFTVDLYNQDGRRISSTGKVTTSKTTCHIQSVPSGMYFLKVITEDGRFYTSKLIIE
jgi:Secretion system C-terminal sorting domain